MVSEVDISVLGDKRLMKKLAKLPGKIQRKVVRSALRKAAKPALARAKELAPVKTGALRKGIRLRKDPHTKRDQIALAIRTGSLSEMGLPYGRFYYPAVVEYKHKSYMRAAADDKRADFYRIAKTEIGNGIEREAKRGA